jgi:hypothetical protein
MPRLGPIDYTIHTSSRVVAITSHEDPSIEEWIAVLEAVLADPKFEPGFVFLSDRRAVTAPASTSFIEQAAAYLSERPAVFGGSRWAILVDTPGSYGMARMGQAIVNDQSSLEVRIFRDPADALMWLTDRRRTER